MTFSISVDVNAILAKLIRLEQLDGVADALDSEADLLVTDEQTYPPELPNQRYVRTYHLRAMTKRSAVQRSGSVVSVAITSEAEYAGAVVGENQKPAFVGRWRRFKKVAQDRVPGIRAAVHAAVIRSWGA